MNTIRWITSSMHGVIDYAGAFGLITIPLIANFKATSVIALGLSVGAGLALLTYSLLTDYRLGLKRLIPFKVHLLLDALASVTFLLAPVLFGFDGFVRLFFWANGVAVLIAVGLSDYRSVPKSTALH
ncbi:hypothetical protein XM38_014910 [Halomicronema hongdechloris C2206]|uniref:Uncharacterized protein n=1 Tax=Halomicronema hongdechloris C2206 TaxID=1641165 RepID=A0A1Z3HJS0_9CYAN|nr:hypothetical protein [Halomicronema hongdechloris]ASC70551.1 hypothetical protein XM38_014910 [Halomicronema hongdechloris C2206]